MGCLFIFLGLLVIKKNTEKARKKKIFLNPDKTNPSGTFILEEKKGGHVEEGKNNQLEKGITVWDGTKRTTAERKR